NLFAVSHGTDVDGAVGCVLGEIVLLKFQPGWVCVAFDHQKTLRPCIRICLLRHSRAYHRIVSEFKVNLHISIYRHAMSVKLAIFYGCHRMLEPSRIYRDTGLGMAIGVLYVGNNVTTFGCGHSYERAQMVF